MKSATKHETVLPAVHPGKAGGYSTTEVKNVQSVPKLRVSEDTTLTEVPLSIGNIRKRRLTWHPMHGISLLELMVVVSIMVIMGAMALPQVMSTLKFRTLHNAMLSSAGAIQSVRFQALSTGKPYQITFSHSAATYQFFACSNCANTIYNPTSTFTYAPIVAGTIGLAPGPIPFSLVGGAALAADQTIYFRPGGAVQWVADGTTSCTTPLSMIFTYQGVSNALTVECYGKVTVPQ